METTKKLIYKGVMEEVTMKPVKRRYEKAQLLKMKKDIEDKIAEIDALKLK